MKKKINSRLKFVLKFALNSIILLLLWFSFYKVFRNILLVDYLYEEAIYGLTKIQLIFSKLFLEMLGYNVEIYGKIVKIVGSYGVHLDRGCLGRNTLGLFLGFIIAFPGSIKNKTWFLSLGTVIFIFLNILRIMALAITDMCCRERLDFNHHFAFKIVVYAVIFLLWVWWIQKYSDLAQKKK